MKKFEFFYLHQKSIPNYALWPSFTLYNVCAVPWGVFSTVGGVQYRGGYHEYRGGYLEYRGVFSTVGGYHDKCGWISSVPWGCSVLWGDIMSTVEVILSTVGDIMMHVGDIMSTVEGVQYHGGKSFVI